MSEYMKWGYRIMGVVSLVCAVVGIIYGSMIHNADLQYVGLVGLILATYCDVRIGNGEA